MTERKEDNRWIPNVDNLNGLMRVVTTYKDVLGAGMLS